MKKTVGMYIFVILSLICGVFPVNAQQQIKSLPIDKEVKIGQLENGLTYYIRHNEYPDNQVNFYIAQKVGSILEEDNQRGLAHFLEHMCFKGIKTFPGDSMKKWLESVGVKYGFNLNAVTSCEKTVYTILGVPAERKEVQDTCLMILRDWSDGLLLNAEDIDKERSVIHEEWRSQMPPDMRILEKLLPKIYPNSRYGYRLPIGTMDVVDNFPRQLLVDYYEKWYRPDLQGIIIVGDVDVDYIENKIKEIFSSIKIPVNPAERVYYTVEDNDRPIVAFGSDRELKNNLVFFHFKYDQKPDTLKNSIEWFTQDYMLNMASNMLSLRLNDLCEKADAPFVDYDVWYGDFLLAKTKQAFSIVVLPKAGMIENGISSAYREFLRIMRGGFTSTEYERCRNEYLSMFEEAYNNRNKQNSNQLGTSCVNHFLDGIPIPSMDTKYRVMNEIADQITVEMINEFFMKTLSERNLVVVGMTAEESDCLKDGKVLSLLETVNMEEISAYKDEVIDKPLIETMPSPGKIVKKTSIPEWDATEWILSNGAKVIVKKTDFKSDEIVMKAIAKGGTSVYGDEYKSDLKFLPKVLAQSGLGEMTSGQVYTLLLGKNVYLDVSLKDYNREISGSTVNKDLKTFMEVLYKTYTDSNISSDEFESLRNKVKEDLLNSKNNPIFIFNKNLREFLYESPCEHLIDSEDVINVRRENVIRIIREQLADVSDFTFVFCGNFDETELETLTEQYIASLPSLGKRNQEFNFRSALEIKHGNENKMFTVRMDVPQIYAAVIMSAEIPYSFRNKLLATMSGQIISTKLTEEIRVKEGAVYSINLSGEHFPSCEVSTLYKTVFPMKPGKEDVVIKIIDEEFNKISKETPGEELNKVKEFMLKTYAEYESNNYYWSSKIADNELVPDSTFIKAKEIIQSITPEEISGFVRSVMKQNNYRVMIMKPEY
ncbi:insulinase family protein [Bacteroides sp.]|uniref:M16 family metallopeptidase n=1 Tax=Bacteroides sp. TaxID=29523 RepID=UPI00258AE7A8|nr:insulinase family protein [Bacteroides sp.]